LAKRGIELRVRRYFVTYWWVWLLIVAAVVAVNEAVDRNFFDHREHVSGDFVLAVLALVIRFFGSYLVARRRSRAVS
jgi:polyferredoxin